MNKKSMQTSQSKPENSETRKNLVPLSEQLGTNISIGSPCDTNWKTLTEKEWSDIQDQHWQSLSNFLERHKK